MVINKVINNNVVSASDFGQEVVAMGRGIGFKRQIGDVIPEEKIEKVFRIGNKEISSRFQELISEIPLEHMKLSADVISYAEDIVKLKLNQSIYLTLTDHINFSILRYKEGIRLHNALLWDIKRLYKQEYLIGEYAVALLNRELNLRFSEDEAGFIALHFVNAEYGSDINDTFAMTNMIQDILRIVEEEFRIRLDAESIHYERFITHLKFLAQRLYRHEMLKDEELELARMMQGKYPEEYACSNKAAEYIKEKYDADISGEEIMYLAIHIKRITM